MSTLFTDWLALYQDPMFLKFPVAAMVLSVGAFLVTALPWTLLAWIDPPWARRYKIQQKPFQIAEFFWPGIFRILKNSIILFLLLVLFWPLLRLGNIHGGDVPEWYVWVIQLVAFIFIDDFLFYWAHRLMHENKWLLRKVHSVHHRIRNTCALDGMYMHWFEHVVISTLTLTAPLILGCHLYVLYAWVIIRGIEGADGHSGYDAPWNLLRYLPFYDGAIYHDFHHARIRGNYAGALHYVDRFFGTYVTEYLEYKNK